MSVNRLFLISALASSLAACGGGGDADLPSNPTLTLSGTAAVGLAVANAPLKVKCQGGSGTATTGADGSYTVKLANGSLPCAVEVQLPADGGKLHSVVAGTGASAVANVTPLTELQAARVTRKDMAAFFDGYDAAAAKLLTPVALKNAQVEVTSLLTGTVDTTKLKDFVADPLKAATPANPTGGDAHDKLLDQLRAKLSKEKFKEMVTLLASGKPLPDPAPGPFQPVLEVQPTTLSLGMGSTRYLLASINYPDGIFYIRQPVSWSVVEADGGKVDAISGLYTAPMKPGTYHVRATRDDYPAVVKLVTVTVTLHQSLEQTSLSGITMARNLVVDNASSWVNLWADHTRGQSNPAPAPAVDFDKDMVVAVFTGTRPLGCYAVTITRTELLANKLRVEYQENTPPSDVVCTTVIASPAHIVAVPRTTLPVEFVANP
ncbi:protease complex subunit PrcB family protein [Roseateles toxinivorans]|uniref:PrcB C-terminal domain-containing protein n=1 Tax=Roseateles toxinivorans TaxID=270368 RepID=A0A4R6QIW7_9BURK|nr:protease complex subunit PrcB family protein [Roseateles toxinivorans]TDP62562.1 hypothetical protein DES47_107140 [Roseateles toxinivorans]